MKKLFSTSIAALAALMFFFQTPAFSQDEGIGDYVSEAAPKGPAAALPPGHYGLIAKYANDFLAQAPGPNRTIFASTLADGADLPDVADEIGDFYVLDIRKAADFCVGHIPGAVNIVFEEVAKPENLLLLPTDKPILVVCYSGQTASQVNAILNLLGYNAWTLRFGMMGWRSSTLMATGSPTQKQLIYGQGLPVVPCE